MKRIFSGIAAAAVLMTSIAGTSLADTMPQNPFSQSQQSIEQNQMTPPAMTSQQNQMPPSAMSGQQNQDEQNQMPPSAMFSQQNQDEQNQMTPSAMPGQQNQGEQNQMTPSAMPGQQNQGEQNQMTPPAMPGRQNQGEQNQMLPPAMPGQQNQEGQNPTMTIHTGNSGRLNMREEPGMDAKVTGQYRNGTQVEILEVGDEWVKVSINGKTGYMMIKFLEGELPSDQSSERPELPADQSGERPEMPGNGQMPGMPGEMPGNESVNYTAAATVTESSSGTAYASTPMAKTQSSFRETMFP